MEKSMATDLKAAAKGNLLKTTLIRLGKVEELGIFGSLVVIGMALALTTEQFATPTNLVQVLRQTAFIGTMAVGMVFVISLRDIDISVGTMYNLSVIIMAYVLREGLNPGLIIPFGLLVGALLGFTNGALSVIFRLPTIIVTLGTMTAYKGLSLVISNASTIANFPNRDHWFYNIFGGRHFGGYIHASTILMLIVAVIGYILYNHTAYGRHVCAIGANPEAARFAGIKVQRTRLITMTLMGVIAAISGMGTLAFLAAADPSFGAGSELIVIAAVIIGGTSLAGGSGSIWGAIIGSLIITVIRNGLLLLGVSIYWQGVVTGITIIGAVALDYVIKRQRGS
jgi:ribose transport system permease protein